MRAVAVALIPIACAACGSSDGSGAVEGSPADAAVDAPGETEAAPTLRHPPPKTAGAPQASSSTRTIYAARRISFGDTNLDGTPNPDAYRDIGLDLDGIASTAATTDHCRPAPGADAVKQDLADGVDDAWGAFVMPGVIDTYYPAASGAWSDAIAGGAATLVVAIDGVDDGASYVDVHATAWAGYQLGGAARFDGTDAWPVADATTLDGGWVTERRWVSGPADALHLLLGRDEPTIELVIHHPTLVVDLRPDATGALHGTLAGVLPMTELLATLHPWAGRMGRSTCIGSLWTPAEEEIVAAADILDDATQDASRDCDAVSIGVALELRPAASGPATTAPDTLANPCIPDETVGPRRP